MKNIYDQKISTVSLFISGRPLIVNEELNLSDAFVQLWLPGSAIEGLTDVIFTDADNQIIYDFKGKLSYSWPKIASQFSLNFKDNNYNPLFEYKYGLNYKDDIYIDSIGIENALPKPSEIILFVGSAYSSYREVISYFDISKNEQAYEGINSDIFEHLKSGITISKFDFKKQDDAKKIDFGNQKFYKSWEIASGTNEDLSYMNQGSIQLIIRPQKIANEELKFSIGCSKTSEETESSGSDLCYKSFNLSDILKEKKNNEWQVIEIPLTCLNDSDFNISSITSRANLGTKGDWILDLHSIKYINNRGYNACKLNSANYE
jgi:beta-glucosidase